MEVRHMLVVGEDLIRSLVGLHCTPAGALAGTAVEAHFDILGEAHLSIPALERSDIAAVARSDIVAGGRFGTALGVRCCTPCRRM